MELVAAALAWVGASLIVVSDGRRGLAAGLGLAAGGSAVLAFNAAGPLAAGALAIGGAVAVARRSASGPEGWGILPSGSTPRLVLCIAAAIIAFWVAAGVTTGAGAPFRFTVILVTGLAGARVLAGEDPPALLTATALLALGIGLGAAFGPGSSAAWTALVGGLVAAAVVWLPAPGVRAA